MYDVAVIGGGVVGCAIARELSKYRLDVVLIEKEAEVGFGTTKTNSGIIHAGHHSPAESLKGKLVVKGNRMFDELQKELGFGFRRCGEIVIARNEEDLKTLDELKALGEKKGVKGLELWDVEKLRREEPNLSISLKGALYAPTAGVINPYEFAFALMECAEQNGVELLVESPVQGISKDGEGLLIKTSNKDIKARYVLNCAGVFADKVAEMLDLHDFTIHPRKGEEYMLDKGLEGIVKRLIFPVPRGASKGILIIPTYDGTIMVGPTAQEVDDPNDVSTSEKGANEVFSFVGSVCPSIHPRHTIAEFAGLRAASNTGDFVIGSTSVNGFINVAGIQSPGLTASPAIALHVLDILGQEGLELIAKESWNAHVEHPPRFANLSTAERTKLCKENKDFGSVVCRCELVTEAEIQIAIDHGARTLDGVKFRTRAGMGRCQGGFCSCRIMDDLADRQGKKFHEITKRGKDSWIVKPAGEEN